MLRPSYSELMDAVMQEDDLDPRVVSRYTLVLAAAKRARQITEGAPPLTYAPTDSAVSIAVKELHEGKLKIKVEENLLDGNIEKLLKHKERYRAISALSKDDLREDLKDAYEPGVYDAYDDADDADDADDVDDVDEDEAEDISFVADDDVKNDFVDIFDETLMDVGDDIDVEIDEIEENIDEE